jgi:hypothetical protein
MRRWWFTWSLAVLLCLVSLGYTDERRRSPFPPSEHWDGYRTWRPERDRRGHAPAWPDRFTIDRPGKCEVRCERRGRDYRCREYRC